MNVVKCDTVENIGDEIKSAVPEVTEMRYLQKINILFVHFRGCPYVLDYIRQFENVMMCSK